jgi:GeoRSP system SPASM domain protein
MNAIAELGSPIRTYWDVNESTSASECRRIARELVANKMLSLQITETGSDLSPSCLAILDSLKNDPLAVSLVAPLSALDAAAISRIQQTTVKVLFAVARALSDLDAVAALSGTTKGKPAIGLSFPVNRENFRDLPTVLSFCVEQKVPHLLLPMQRLMTDEQCFSFTKAERDELSAKLGEIAKPANLKITIHDPFLWRAFYPTIEFPNGGCQAANTMLYIAPNADVYPCPTLPIKMGSLLLIPLKDLISSAVKKDLRRKILQKPVECETCSENDQCKGGCRGRAHRIAGSLQAPDPACR